MSRNSARTVEAGRPLGKSHIAIGLVAILSLAPSAYGQNQCVALPSNPITVDGLVTGAGIVPTGGGGPGSGCTLNPNPGWGGVVAQPIPVFGTPDTQTAYLLVAGHSGGATNLDHLYFGVHVQNTPSLSTSDHVTMYFHFGSGGSFASPDFAIEYDIGASTAAPDSTPTDSECGLAPSSALRYYVFSAGNWTAQSAPAGITVKKSWNFVAAQPDVGIWELEIGLDLSATALNITVPSSATGVLSVGAKVYAHDAVLNEDTIYYYPAALSTDSDTSDYLPQFGNVTSPASLQAFDVGTCGNDVMITGIKATDASGNANQFTIPTSVGGTANNQFSATAKFYNPANPSDSSIVGTANTGQIEFHILPWNGGFTGDFLMGSPTINFTRLNQEVPVPTSPATIPWPTGGDWTANAANVFGTANHACFIVKISPTNGFNVNIVNANDMMQQNLAFTTNSTVRDSFLISAKDTKLQPHNGYIDYVLRVKLRNVKDQKRWHFKIRDGDDIGLKKIAKDYYSLRLKPGEEKRVKIELSGVLMPGTTHQYSIPATAGGTFAAPKAARLRLIFQLSLTPS